MFGCLVATIFGKMVWIKALAKLDSLVNGDLYYKYTVFINCMLGGFSLAKQFVFQITNFSPINHLCDSACI